MPSLEYLSQRFMVTKTEIHEHIRNQYPKIKAIQLSTNDTTQKREELLWRIY